MKIKELEERLFSSEENNILEYRSNFFRDRARLVHSAAFRRLQGKTQVLGLGESDFYRTRLTHSLEVASLSQSIAKSIADKIKHNKYKNFSATDYQNVEKLISVDDYEFLLEAIGLAHDIGHPPFGHGGERALHKKMKSHGGFEGNAQTIRILNKLAEYDNNHGLNPTVRLVLGVLKYPIKFSESLNEHNSIKPPKCIYDDDYQIIKEKFSQYFTTQDLEQFFETKPVKYKESVHKSFDCLIMELADDISYAVHDLEDGVALRLLREDMFDIDDLKNIFEKMPTELKEKVKNINCDAKKFINELCCSSNKKRKKCINTLIYLLINSIQIEINSNFQHPIFMYTPKLTNWGMIVKNYFFSRVKENIILSPEVQHLELKGEKIVEALFDILYANPETLLEIKDRNLLSSNPQMKERIICDYIAGMTDSYASKIYKRIFIPDNGSVFDRL
ncbi:anti-phage deoxyguanosine triphosphatase [Aeromonas veronii]